MVIFDTELFERSFLAVFSSARLSCYLFRFREKHNLVCEDGREYCMKVNILYG